MFHLQKNGASNAASAVTTRERRPCLAHCSAAVSSHSSHSLYSEPNELITLVSTRVHLTFLNSLYSVLGVDIQA